MNSDTTPHGDEVEEIYKRFTALADRKKRIYDQDLIALPARGAPVSSGLTTNKQSYLRQRAPRIKEHMKLTITVLEGDGIGPEVTREAVKVLRAIATLQGHKFEFIHRPIGGVAIKQTGSPLPRVTLILASGVMQCFLARSVRRNSMRCRRTSDRKRACCSCDARLVTTRIYARRSHTSPLPQRLPCALISSLEWIS